MDTRFQVPDSWSMVSVDEGDVCVEERPAHPATSRASTTNNASERELFIT